MTSKKQLKARIRARMAKTGESYTAARRHVAGAGVAGPRDGAWRFHGGVHAGSAVIASVLGNGGAEVAEPLVFLAGGGIGAGYILWEFKRHDSRHLTLGFRNQWQYPIAWMDKTLGRLGVRYETHSTAGAKGAAARLAAELDAGRPCVILPDRYHLGLWGLPAHLDGHGGHPVIAYRREDGVVRLDDRGLAPLLVPQERLDAARARVSSYKNVLHVVPDPTPVAEETLVRALREGLGECVGQLSKPSDSFSLPAWRKWARLMTDTRNAKAWPAVFADGRGLAGALLAVWEGVEPVGADGGNLRGLFGDALEAAAEPLGVPELKERAAEWRGVDAMWHDLAEAALPADVPEFARLRELTAAVRETLHAEGTAGAAEIEEAAGELWAARAEYDVRFPLGDPGPLFEDLSARLHAVHEAETEAVARLRALV